MIPIFHITSLDSWTEAQAAGTYSADSLATEGFIHCSTRAQILGTANRFYPGRSGLLLLALDPERIVAELRYEESGGMLFPHIYGHLNLDAVVATYDFAPGPDGTFSFPPMLASS